MFTNYFKYNFIQTKKQDAITYFFIKFVYLLIFVNKIIDHLITIPLSTLHNPILAQYYPSIKQSHDRPVAKVRLSSGLQNPCALPRPLRYFGSGEV